MNNSTLTQEQQSIEEEYADYPVLRYSAKADKSEMPVEALYWHIKAVLSMFHIGMVSLKEGCSNKLYWIIHLLKGTLPTVDGDCRMKDCNNRSIAYVPDDKRLTDGTPVCRRHYLIIKTTIYTIFAFFFSMLSYPIYYSLVVT